MTRTIAAQRRRSKRFAGFTLDEIALALSHISEKRFGLTMQALYDLSPRAYQRLWDAFDPEGKDRP
jgi:hypothetical protein